MSPTYEYFLAAFEDQAAGVLNRVAGPSSTVPPPKSGFFGKKSSSAPSRAVDLQVLPGAGVEPVVVLGQLEAIVTNRTFEDVLGALGDPVVAAREGSELVLRVSKSIGPGLSALSADERRGAAVKWAEIEEFYGTADPQDLLKFIDDFAEFTERGRDRGLGLYCWWSL